MKLKIKNKYVGATIVKSGSKYKLTSDMSQKAISFIKNSVSPEYVEVVKPKPRKSEEEK